MEKLEDYVKNNVLNIEEIINDYSKFLYKVIKNNSYNLTSEDIEEIISDSFFALWKNYNKMNSSDNVKNYLVGCSKNILLNKLKKNKKDVNNVNIENYINIVKTNDDIENSYEEQEKVKFVENIINNIDKESREIFILFYYEQRKIKEISKIMNISEAKIKVRLHRTRKKIKKELEKGGYRYGI